MQVGAFFVELGNGFATLHHACYHGNYGFLFNFMGGWCGTRLPDTTRRTE